MKKVTFQLDEDENKDEDKELEDEDEELEVDSDDELLTMFNNINIEEKRNVIRQVYDMFLNKYIHLDNRVNRMMIFELCKMSVESMPEHLNKPLIYLNFLESSIIGLVNENKNKDKDFFN